MKYQTNEIDMTEKEEERVGKMLGDVSETIKHLLLPVHPEQSTPYAQKYIEFRSNGLKSPL